MKRNWPFTLDTITVILAIVVRYRRFSCITGTGPHTFFGSFGGPSTSMSSIEWYCFSFPCSFDCCLLTNRKLQEYQKNALSTILLPQASSFSLSSLMNLYWFFIDGDFICWPIDPIIFSYLTWYLLYKIARIWCLARKKKKFFFCTLPKNVWLNLNEHLDPRLKERLIGDDFDKISNNSEIFAS